MMMKETLNVSTSIGLGAMNVRAGATKANESDSPLIPLHFALCQTVFSLIPTLLSPHAVTTFSTQKPQSISRALEGEKEV
jgi:hypothetical protein